MAIGSKPRSSNLIIQANFVPLVLHLRLTKINGRRCPTTPFPSPGGRDKGEGEYKIDENTFFFTPTLTHQGGGNYKIIGQSLGMVIAFEVEKVGQTQKVGFWGRQRLHWLPRSSVCGPMIAKDKNSEIYKQ
jgi:hypothetical protein